MLDYLIVKTVKKTEPSDRQISHPGTKVSIPAKRLIRPVLFSGVCYMK